MPLSNDEILVALRGFNERQIQLAGQRYTPGVEPGAPNLIVATLLTAVEGVSSGPAAKKRFSQFLAGLRRDWDRAKYACEQREHIQAAIDALKGLVDTSVPRMCARDTAAIEEWNASLSTIAADLEAERTRWHDQDALVSARESEEKDSQTSHRSTERDTIQSHIHTISRCLGNIDEEQQFIASSGGKVLVDPSLLIRGEWGTGKTHLLCDVTVDRIRAQQPTLLILAKSFLSSGELLELISGQISPGLRFVDLIDHLQNLGVSCGERSIIIIDGANEGRRAEWRRAISDLLSLIRDRSHVGLIVSCRTPFERIAISEADLNLFHQVEHRGFEDQEFDAQAAFFQHYNLPLPEVPLLDSEFSRPLTLKLICQSLKDLTGKKLSKGFSGIASGQKGMTYVLESFINRVGEPIEKEFGLRARACWTLLKGRSSISDRKSAGFAPCMAATLHEYVLPRAADMILATHFPTLSKKRRTELLDAMRTSGLIDEDALWYRKGSEGRSRIVYRLPYQRFSDHLIARHLLEAYLDVSSETAVKRSLARGKPLHRIFRRGRYSQGYAYSGWVQALITEFPERVKKRVRSNRREMFYFLPRTAQHLSMYFEPFVEGLFWRDPAAFTEGTRRVINACLNLNRRDAWDRVIDVLVAVSTKPNHPYHSLRLYKFLAKSPMPVRDARWSEYLRKGYRSPAAQRLVAWAERLNTVEMKEDVAKEFVVLISLLLTTVNRKNRDIVTRALVTIGEQYPRALFDHVVRALSFNDPYVPERMLAAAYGVTMSLVDRPGALAFRPQLGWLARQLYRSMFKPNARYCTHHVLQRDYALGILTLAQRAGCVVLPKTSKTHLSSPFSQIPSPFGIINSVSTQVHETAKFAIQMDFGNYTIGRLIPDRGNYDFDNPEYVRVRAQIEQRMYDLGYRKSLFKDIDGEIARFEFHGRPDGAKVDRYGKKYAWIAYFEMYGLREANKLLSDRRLEGRTSDVDIDPSFPRRPDAWVAPIPDVFGDLSKDSDTWVASGDTPDFSSLNSVSEINGVPGPWILLEGFVRKERVDIDREFFVFLRGLFVSRRDTPRLQNEFLSIDYPGNHKIPDGGEEYYLYAGEAGRSNRYAPELYMSNGRYRRQTREAFDHYVTDTTTVDTTSPVATGIRIVLPSNSKDEDVDIERVISFPSHARYRKVQGVKIEAPVRTFLWESYHSSQNNFSGFLLPSPSLIQRLNLSTSSREIDFRDEVGRLATAYRESGNGWKGDRFQLLFMRSDLLREYLKMTRQQLVWCNWGERGWAQSAETGTANSDQTRRAIFQKHLHIHRRFHVWRISNT